MTADERAPARLNLFGLATALMTALAGGAVWALLALGRQTELAFLALPLGAFIGRLLAGNGPRSTVLAAACALLFTLSASVYALGMIASGDVAMLLGMRLTDILRQIGPELATAVAWARLDAFDLACIGAGAVLAAVCASWRRARRQSSEPSKS